MLQKYLLIILIFASSTLLPQTYLCDYSIDNFKSASSFTVNPAGFFFITDSGTNEVYKIDTLGKIIKEAGGYGWSSGLFDDPSCVFATTLSVYVCDKNNHRVEKFDRELNFISLLYTRNSDNSNEQFGYPTGCAVSNQGDLYVLDTENKRVVKFDLFGNFVQNFGGYDAGSYSLSAPKKIAVSQNNDVYVIDGERIVIFDQYGNGLSIITIDKKLESIHITFNMLTVTTKDTIYAANLSLSSSPLVLEPVSFSLENEKQFVSSLIYNNKLYILTHNDILVLIPLNKNRQG